MAVSATFDFGLREEHYTFVALRDFTHRDLGAHRLGVAEVARVFKRTTIINGYTFNNSPWSTRNPFKQVSAATHAPAQQVVINDLAYVGATSFGRPVGLPAGISGYAPLVEFRSGCAASLHPSPNDGRGPGGPGDCGPQPGPGGSGALVAHSRVAVRRPGGFRAKKVVPDGITPLRSPSDCIIRR
jgi:hypothetical protein